MFLKTIQKGLVLLTKSYKLSIVIFVCIAQIYYYNQVYCERMTHEKGFNGALQNIITEQKQNMQAAF